MFTCTLHNYTLFSSLRQTPQWPITLIYIYRFSHYSPNYIITHPVNFPCGRKPENSQSLLTLISILMFESLIFMFENVQDFISSLRSKFKHSKVIILGFLNATSWLKYLDFASYFQPACLHLEIRGRTL